MKVVELYQKRSHCLTWRVFPGPHSPSSMGGAPPLEAPEPACPSCGCALKYWLTLGEDLLGPEVCRGSVVSLFFCDEGSGECLWAARDPNAKGGLVAIAHPASDRVAGSHPPPWARERYVIAPNELIPSRDDGPLTKTGGKPTFVQGWGEEEVERISNDFGFLFQVEDWPDGATPKRAILGGGGAVYVFARLEPRKKLPTLREFRIFCQM